MKHDGTEYDRVPVKEEQDRRAPTTPAAHELTPAQLELVAGGNTCGLYSLLNGACFVKR